MLLHKFELNTSPKKPKSFGVNLWKKTSGGTISELCKSKHRYFCFYKHNEIKLRSNPRLIVFWNGLDGKSKAKCFVAMLWISRLPSKENTELLLLRTEGTSCGCCFFSSHSKHSPLWLPQITQRLQMHLLLNKARIRHVGMSYSLLQMRNLSVPKR